MTAKDKLVYDQARPYIRAAIALLFRLRTPTSTKTPSDYFTEADGWLAAFEGRQS